MEDIVPNTTPAVGKVAIFKYNTVKHIALITKLNQDSFEVKEANYRPALIDTRTVSWDDSHLVGFWSAE